LIELRQAGARRLRAWVARRFGADALPHTVNRRRIYILPSGFGLALAALILAMLVAALNYNNNLGLAFAFLMTSIALVAMHHCHRNLLGLVVDAETDTDGFAGASAPLAFTLANASGLDRYDVQIRCADDAVGTASVAATSRCAVVVHVPIAQRGVRLLAQFELATRYPFGWFRAWTYVQAAVTIHAAPQPQGERPRSGSSTAFGATLRGDEPGDEDWAGLRPYAPGMPLKHMAWKVLARGDEAAVRTYSSPASDPQWLDWYALTGLAEEARLSQLCRWVLDADRAARTYGLRLPEASLGPAAGPAHRRACLRALAAHDAADAP
jgi:uncharacterized protein (DUF58 family)